MATPFLLTGFPGVEQAGGAFYFAPATRRFSLPALRRHIGF